MHEFYLSPDNIDYGSHEFDNPQFAALKAAPPAGCVAEDLDGFFALRCRREASSLFEAVAQVCAEVKSRYGLDLTDLGIEKLWEWWDVDSRDGHAAQITAQLLLMGRYRAARLGYTLDDVIAFLRGSTEPT